MTAPRAAAAASEAALAGGPAVDLHNHLIPGVDDGARTLEQARFALVMMRDQGVAAVVTTPHVSGTVTADPAHLSRRLEELDRGWKALSGLVGREFPQFPVQRGAEVMLDTPAPDLSDPRLRLAGTRFALVEFPHMVVPPRSTEALRGLVAAGWTPIIAHPERYGGMLSQLRLAGEWRDAGCYLQLNGASLLGGHSAEAARVAAMLLERGWADLVASDYHAHGQPRIRAARDELVRVGGAEQARLLIEVNPLRILQGESPLPVPGLQRTRTGLWQRVRSLVPGL